MNEERKNVLKTVEKHLDYRFRDLALLDGALTHRSYAHEMPGGGVADNERLEFLGDAVLDLCISDLLMRRFPNDSEGRLSKRRAACVNERALADLAKRFHLGEGLLLGKGEEMSGGRDKSSILANAMEAVIAAIYLDSGFQEAMMFIRCFYRDIIQEESVSLLYRDYKTLLQEICQARYHIAPRYAVIQEHGPDHDKTFEVRLDILAGMSASGTGKSRKEAEQEAARKAVEYLEGLPATTAVPDAGER